MVMSQAPEQLIEWARELEGAFEGFLESEKELKDIIDDELDRGEEAVQNEKKELHMEGEIEKDIEEIQQDLIDIQNDIEEMNDLIENRPDISDSDLLRSFKGKFEHDLIEDIKQIEGDLKEVRDSVHLIKEMEKENLESINIEVEEYETTYELLAQGDSEIGKVDEMTDAFLKTASDSGDEELSRISSTLENLRKKLESKLSELEREESGVGNEIAEEEDLVLKEITEDDDILKEIKKEIQEDKKILRELDKLREATAKLGGQEIAAHIEEFENQLSSIEEVLEAIFGAIEEMEQALKQEKEELDEANPES
jgi:uncharacterized phage infection (PIP) family protein YhgE